MASEEIDLTIAMQLQAQFEEENRQIRVRESSNAVAVGGQNLKRKRSEDFEDKSTWVKLPCSLVDPCWEMLDPTPDVRALFVTFDRQFFKGKLGGVEVNWSPKMTRCAGLCRYQGRAGCVISLSTPLLKLRPRSDLVETLLHEMIHAYLFVTFNNKDRDGHGPEFHKHMWRINFIAGTNISVYHTFHDEVNVYLQHIWRCDGPCRRMAPYYGFVKRSMNRAPGPNDVWWGKHASMCSGTFTKVKEPEGFGEKKQKKRGVSNSAAKTPGSPTKNMGSDIRAFFSNTGSSSGLSSSFVGKGQRLGNFESNSGNVNSFGSNSSVNKVLTNSGTMNNLSKEDKDNALVDIGNIDSPKKKGVFNNHKKLNSPPKRVGIGGTTDSFHGSMRKGESGSKGQPDTKKPSEVGRANIPAVSRMVGNRSSVVTVTSGGNRQKEGSASSSTVLQSGNNISGFRSQSGVEVASVDIQKATNSNVVGFAKSGGNQNNGKAGDTAIPKVCGKNDVGTGHKSDSASSFVAFGGKGYSLGSQRSSSNYSASQRQPRGGNSVGTARKSSEMGSKICSAKTDSSVGFKNASSASRLTGTFSSNVRDDQSLLSNSSSSTLHNSNSNGGELNRSVLLDEDYDDLDAIMDMSDDFFNENSASSNDRSSETNKESKYKSHHSHALGSSFSNGSRKCLIDGNNGSSSDSSRVGSNKDKHKDAFDSVRIIDSTVLVDEFDSDGDAVLDESVIVCDKSFVECPVCSDKFHKDLIERHANDHFT